MKLLFDLIYGFLAIFYLPLIFLKNKWHSEFNTRLGSTPEVIKNIPKDKKRIWVHAVSVGEVMVIAGLIQKLQEQYLGYQIICSTVTETGNTLAKQKLGDDVIVVYAPVDFSWIVKKAIRAIRPSLYISAETEIWPNVYLTLRKAKVPIVLVNGRISTQSYKGYQWIKIFLKPILQCVDCFCMQSQLDAQRIISLGADEKHVHVVGNLKFDYEQLGMPVKKEDLGYSSDHNIIVAGSTHPGEEEIVLDVYKKVIEEFPNTSLIIAPRHIERAQSILRLVEGYYLPAKYYSRIRTGEKIKEPVIVVDTIGHLIELYGIATIVFMGKSLSNVGFGGQNMMEPSFFAKPVIVGPHTDNFKDAMAVLLRENAIKQVQDKKQLLDAIIVFLKKPERMKEYGERARHVCLMNQGATDTTVNKLAMYLRD